MAAMVEQRKQFWFLERLKCMLKKNFFQKKIYPFMNNVIKWPGIWKIKKLFT